MSIYSTAWDLTLKDLIMLGFEKNFYQKTSYKD